jgi:hypothetical protein
MPAILRGYGGARPAVNNDAGDDAGPDSFRHILKHAKAGGAILFAPGMSGMPFQGAASNSISSRDTSTITGGSGGDPAARPEASPPAHGIGVPVFAGMATGGGDSRPERLGGCHALPG